MDNASDRKDVRRREKAAKLDAAQRADVIRSLMSTTYGRKWMWDLLATTHMFTTTFNGNALQSAYHEGQRSTGLALLADILLTCPDQYILAMREANERSATDERRSSPVDDGGDPGSVDGDNTTSDRIQDVYGDGNDYDSEGNRYHS